MRTENYGYDELSRLKTANYGDGQWQGYSFDAMGNRTAKTDNVTGAEGYAFDNANRIATRQVGSNTATSYTSDANGNTLSDGSGIGSRVNTWDSQNRLVSCARQTDAQGSKDISEFRYGADGLRRRMLTYQQEVGIPTGGQGLSSGEDNLLLLPPIQLGTVTHYGYDGTNVIREWESNAAGVLNISATYLLGPSGPMYRRPATAADVRWYVYDGLGSVVGEVDVNGTLIAEKKHDVYGLRRGNVGTQASRHGFVGSLGHYSDDETGLIYMRARYYDPAIGRFISEDPRGDGTNWFTYCANNPTNLVDADGRTAAQLFTKNLDAFCGMIMAYAFFLIYKGQKQVWEGATLMIGAKLASMMNAGVVFPPILSPFITLILDGAAKLGEANGARTAVKGAGQFVTGLMLLTLAQFVMASDDQWGESLFE